MRWSGGRGKYQRDITGEEIRNRRSDSIKYQTQPPKTKDYGIKIQVIGVYAEKLRECSKKEAYEAAENYFNSINKKYKGVYSKKNFDTWIEEYDKKHGIISNNNEDKGKCDDGYDR